MERLLSTAFVVGLLVFPGCGCESPTPPPPDSPDAGLGSALNDAWDLPAPPCTGTVTGGTFSSGAFSVAIASGELSPCANVTAPGAAAQPRPEALELRTGDVLVTSGGESYRFTLGEQGFHTNGAVTLRVPFDGSQIPAALRDPLHVFLRLHVPADDALVEVTGRLEGDAVVAELRGLPAAVDVAVIYNPNQRAVLARAHPKLTPFTWGANAWCAVYQPADPAVIAAVSEALGVAGPPSLAEMDAVITSKIAQAAVTAQLEYQAQGFRQPDLYIATSADEPCKVTDPRFLVHYVLKGNKFRGFDRTEVIGPDGNHFGRLYVSTGATNWTMARDGATVLDVVAHELQHGVQAGYALWGLSLLGYKEGASTTYGHSIALSSAQAQVRSRQPGETFLLSNFLMVSTGVDPDLAYSNQDFVAYLARARNGGSNGFLTGLFQALHDHVESAAAAQPTPAAQHALRFAPPRAVLLHAMDAWLQTSMSTNLRTEYLAFLRERAFDHGPTGFFARAGETGHGFAPELFARSTDLTKNALFTLKIDPVTCAIEKPIFLLASVAPLAARAVRFVPTATAADKPVSIHLTLEDGTGGIGQLGTATRELEPLTVFDGFGRTTDSLDVAFTNLDLDGRKDLTVRVACEATTDTGVTLPTWKLTNHDIAVQATVKGPGLTVTADQVAGGYTEVTEVNLASALPATLGISLKVTPPPPKTDSTQTTRSYAILSYAYTLKQVREDQQVKHTCGPSVDFTLDASTMRQFTPQYGMFEVVITVTYEVTASWVWPGETEPTTSTNVDTFDALALVAYVTSP